MSEKLKPCPFCGGKHIGLDSPFAEHYIVICDCGISTAIYEHAADAVAAWNRRAGDE